MKPCVAVFFFLMCLDVDCVDPHDIIFHNNMPAVAIESILSANSFDSRFPGTAIDILVRSHSL